MWGRCRTLLSLPWSDSMEAVLGQQVMNCVKRTALLKREKLRNWTETHWKITELWSSVPSQDSLDTARFLSTNSHPASIVRSDNGEGVSGESRVDGGGGGHSIYPQRERPVMLYWYCWSLNLQYPVSSATQELPLWSLMSLDKTSGMGPKHLQLLIPNLS